MTSKGIQTFSRGLNTLRSTISKDPLTQCLAPRFARTMATEASMSNVDYGTDLIRSSAEVFQPSPTVLTTIYKFPEMEPLRFEPYNSKHLHLPLRRDLLHRAVVFEGDFTRQGTGSTKTRWEIHGSHRKIRPQKGTGRARLGSRQAPHLSGGAKAFGPKPRDFATQLPKKMYDLAWRIALSMRYRKGELIICENEMELEHDKSRYAKAIMEHNRWGNADGRTLFVTLDERTNLFTAMEDIPDQGKALQLEDVDVKNLLELGRVVIEKRALDKMLKEHQSDLIGNFRKTA